MANQIDNGNNMHIASWAEDRKEPADLRARLEAAEQQVAVMREALGQVRELVEAVTSMDCIGLIPEYPGDVLVSEAQFFQAQQAAKKVQL